MKPQNRRQPEDQGCRGLPPEQQNVMAVSARHRAATTTPHNCCPNSYAEQSHKDNVRSSTVGKQLKQKKSNSLAQHHLPALDLFWASFFMRVQLISLLLILPGLFFHVALRPRRWDGLLGMGNITWTLDSVVLYHIKHYGPDWRDWWTWLSTRRCHLYSYVHVTLFVM